MSTNEKVEEPVVKTKGKDKDEEKTELVRALVGGISLHQICLVILRFRLLSFIVFFVRGQ